MGKKNFFALTMVVLAFICNIGYVSANDNSATDYEQFYPEYMDSKEPLGVIRDRDHQLLETAAQNLEAQTVLFPITMPYGDFPLQQLDIYRLPGKESRPVIFFIHHGMGDKKDVAYALPAWLSLGYVVVSINHRVVPVGTFPEMVEDVNTALKWVTDYIQNYGGDPDRIAVTGMSCGAHLAAMLMTDTASQKQYGIDISKVKCWFPISGFYDMDLKENLISIAIKPYIGWICVPSKQAASPAALATGKEPPCLIIHGADDWSVPKTNAVSLYNHLNKEKTTLAILKGYMHANVFFTYLEADHEPARLIKDFLATYLPTKINPKIGIAP